MWLPTLALVFIWSAPTSLDREEVGDEDGFLLPRGFATAPRSEGRAKRRGVSPKGIARKGQLLSNVKGFSRGRDREALEPSIAMETTALPRRRGVCPGDMVPVGSSYCVDMYEGGLTEVLSTGGERPWSPYLVPTEDRMYRATSAPGVVPQGYISGKIAKAACERADKRLCTRDEWKRACMGPKGTMYPYGNTRQTGKCNDHGRSSMLFYFQLDDKPENAWKWGFNGNMIDPRLNQLEGTLAKTGEHPECTNEYGAFDMMGNLHEWVDDPAGTFQGGYYLDTHLNGDGCYYATTAHPMSHFDYSTGFRCCADLSE